MRFLSYLLLCIAISCSSNYQLTEIAAYANNNRLENTQSDQEQLSIIEPYKQGLNETMNEVLGTVAKNLSKTKPESPLGNVLADATKNIAEKQLNKSVDIGVVNYGGIRLPQLSKGEITIGTVYELMPFDNYLVVLTLTGTELQTVLDAIASKGGWPISGVQLTIENQRASNITVGNNPLDKSKNYTLAISDYVANGGDNMTMLKNLPQENTNLLLREAFIEYFKQLQAEKGSIDAFIELRTIINE